MLNVRVLTLSSCALLRCGTAAPTQLAVSGSSSAVVRVSQRLESLTNTPAASFARRLRKAVAPCTHFACKSSDVTLDHLLGSVGCVPPSDPARDTIHFTIPVSGHTSYSVSGRAVVDEHGGVVAKVDLMLDELTEAWTALLPSTDNASLAILAPGDLAHLHLRSGPGLDFSDLVSEKISAFYGIGGSLFAGVVLDGNIEFAMYSPAEGAQSLPVAVAFGIRSRSAARQAVEEFIERLRQRWSFHPSGLGKDQPEGACLRDLRVMPGFAPCYALTDDALVISWNQADLKRSLSPTVRSPAVAIDSPAKLIVYLDEFPAADRALTLSRYGVAGPTTAYPFSTISVTGEKVDHGYTFRVRLRAKAER